MKKVIFLLALALIVAGGAFAQRVGDTVQLGGQTWAVQSISGDTATIRKVRSLDGVWVSSVGHIITINGSIGVYTQIASTAVWQDAVSKGYVKVGDQNMRNLTSSGNLRWTGQVLTLGYSGNVATRTQWDNTTITMNADGQSFRTSSGTTYTRRQ